ncbi:hypothetical protein LMH73_009165 [Vibrio splendidus]|nr:hypothetical protein [Vibrio splendidus]MCC4880306.1 hypothetical protein [Vibrio splendidus]
MYIPPSLPIEKDSVWLIEKILKSERISYTIEYQDEHALFQLFVGNPSKRGELYTRLKDLASVEKLARSSVQENCVKKQPMSISTIKTIAKNAFFSLAIVSTPVWMIELCKMYDSYAPFYSYLIAHSFIFVMSFKKEGIVSKVLDKIGLNFAYLTLSMGMTLVTGVLVTITIAYATLVSRGFFI